VHQQDMNNSIISARHQQVKLKLWPRPPVNYCFVGIMNTLNSDHANLFTTVVKSSFNYDSAK